MADPRCSRQVCRYALAARHEVPPVCGIASTTLPRRACSTLTNGHAAGCLGTQFDLPNPLAAVATVLLQDTRTGGTKPRRERIAERAGGAGRDGCRCPSQDASCDAATSFTPILRITSGCALTQGPRDATSRSIASSASRVCPSVNRIDPDQHAIDGEKLPSLILPISSANTEGSASMPAFSSSSKTRWNRLFVESRRGASHGRHDTERQFCFYVRSFCLPLAFVVVCTDRRS